MIKQWGNTKALSKIFFNDICIKQMCILILKGKVWLGIILIRELFFRASLGVCINSFLLFFIISYFMVFFAILWQKIIE